MAAFTQEEKDERVNLILSAMKGEAVVVPYDELTYQSMTQLASEMQENAGYEKYTPEPLHQQFSEAGVAALIGKLAGL